MSILFSMSKDIAVLSLMTECHSTMQINGGMIWLLSRRRELIKNWHKQNI